MCAMFYLPTGCEACHPSILGGRLVMARALTVAILAKNPFAVAIQSKKCLVVKGRNMNYTTWHGLGMLPLLLFRCTQGATHKISLAVSIPKLQGTLWLFNIAMENGPFIDGLLDHVHHFLGKT